MKRLFLFSALWAVLFSFPATAQTAGPRKLGQFSYWAAYQLSEGKNPVCYMTLTAKPPMPKGSKIKRGAVTLMVTQRPTEGALDVVSYAAGTKFAPGSEVIVQAQGKKFNLFTQGDTAWARDPATDRALAAAIRAAESITIVGTAAQGGSFADTISMKGSAKAYQAMAEACGTTSSKTK